MIRLRAAWVIPIDRPPISDGWVAVDRARIVALGDGTDEGPGGLSRDLGRVALLPGLVNAHTHLELSWLRDRVPPANRFTSWVKQLFAARGGAIERPDDTRVQEAARAAAVEARAAGTAAVGDISNSLCTVSAIADVGLSAIVFHELLGFRETSGAMVTRSRAARTVAASIHPDVRISVAPHAPYSVSPELFRAIRAEVSAHDVPFTSVHVGESVEELQLLMDGSGEWARILRWLGAWRDDWVAPGVGPVPYLEGLGMFDAGTLVVHGVQLDLEDLLRLRRYGCTLVTCPRSNQWVGVGVPPVGRFYDSGVAVAVGTDSLASVQDLNVFEELKAMRWLAPGVTAGRLLESATLTGARALGLEAELGSLTPGKRAEIIAISLPEDVQDVEEYLVSGIGPSQIRWVGHG